MAKNPNGNTGTDVANLSGSTALSVEMLDEIYGGLTESQSQTVVPGGNPIIKLNKNTGEWEIGINNEPIQEGSRWLIDPRLIAHGYVCWSDTAVKLGEVMVPMWDKTQPKPPMPQPINGFPFKDQMGFVAVALDGSHEGVTGVFRNSSVGAIKGVSQLVTDIRLRLRKAKEEGVAHTDDLYVNPIIRLGSYSYKHSNASFGSIYNPVFAIGGWANHKGDIQGAGKAEGPAAPNPPKPAPTAERKGPSRDRAKKAA
jgi:hypothetical protein